MKVYYFGFLLLCIAFVEVNTHTVRLSAQNPNLDEINNKKNEVMNAINEVNKLINTKNNEMTPNILEEYQQKGQEKYNEFYKKFENNGMKALKLAIIKGKPISAYDCVVKVSIEGRVQLAKLKEDYENSLRNILTNRKNEIAKAKLMIDLITFGLNDAVKEITDKIEKDKNPEKLKKEALQICTNAKSQVTQLKQRLLNMTSLASALFAAQNAMENKYTSVNADLEKKVLNCVS